MDTLPLETLQRIFELACADGGRTGNALSLTSKQVHAAARTTRFRTLSLIANPRRLQSFMALYERECNPALGDKPRIQHLHVAFPQIQREGTRAERRRSLSPPSPTRESVRPSSWRPQTPPTISSDFYAQFALQLGDIHVDENSFQEEHWGRRREPSPDPTASPEYLAAAQTLFRLVSPDLLSLAIQAGFSFGAELDFPVIAQPLPSLRELTLIDVENPSGLFANHNSGRAPSPLFPALTHLHITSFFSCRRLDLRTLAACAPRLTHLRVTGITSALVQQLAEAVGVEVHPFPPPVVVHIPGAFSPPTPPPPPRPRTCPSVRVLVMQPCPEPRGGFCGNPMIEHDEMLEELQQITEGCRGSGIKAILLPPVDNDGQSEDFAEQVREQWLARIQGDTGCWAAAQCADL